MTYTVQQGRNHQTVFDSGAVAVTDDTNFVEVARIPADGRPVVLHGLVGAAALGDAQVNVTSTRGGTESILATGTALDTASQAIWAVAKSSTNIKSTAAAGTFYMFLKAGAMEYVIYAKKASSGSDTTLQITGTIL